MRQTPVQDDRVMAPVLAEPGGLLRRNAASGTTRRGLAAAAAPDDGRAIAAGRAAAAALDFESTRSDQASGARRHAGRA